MQLDLAVTGRYGYSRACDGTNRNAFAVATVLIFANAATVFALLPVKSTDPTSLVL